ncbi:MAG: DNA-binding response regulator [Candidatus Pelagibacter sp.]|nr:DNA-binding response regulator [Candidatus Pelagibacter sp.]|tara:strand:- start:24077 stop:24754 length:678 start_codon:yes stop_codon:yes gene_type:complete
MNNFRGHILVIDDDDGIRNLVKKFLKQKNYLITTASNAFDAEEKLKVIRFDLIVLDIMMPGKSGLEFIRDNKFKINTPIILLTAKGEASDRIEGFEIGADDYLAKPFEPKELAFRINSILKRTIKDHIKRVVEFQNLKIDLNKLYIYKGKTEFKINNTEKKILEQMISLPGKIFTRDIISELIDIDKERSIDVIITRLRKKIEDDPKNPKFLQTIRGEGYVFWIE